MRHRSSSLGQADEGDQDLSNIETSVGDFEESNSNIFIDILVATSGSEGSVEFVHGTSIGATKWLNHADFIPSTLALPRSLSRSHFSALPSQVKHYRRSLDKASEYQSAYTRECPHTLRILLHIRFRYVGCVRMAALGSQQVLSEVILIRSESALYRASSRSFPPFSGHLGPHFVPGKITLFSDYRR